MKRRYKILLLMSYIAIVVSLGTVRASALTEAEVQAQVNAVGKEAVTGNLFVWFLCAVAFLKVCKLPYILQADRRHQLYHLSRTVDVPAQ